MIYTLTVDKSGNKYLVRPTGYDSYYIIGHVLIKNSETQTHIGQTLYTKFVQVSVEEPTDEELGTATLSVL
jgi:hypothetical protein